MLISADPDALEVHSKLMDTVDMYIPESILDDDRTARENWLDGYLCGIKRRRLSPKDEAKLAAHKQPDYAESKNPPKRYRVLVRGRHRVPEWEEDMDNKYSDECGGMMIFKDGEMCEFELKNMRWRDFRGVPRLPQSTGEGSATGYKVASRPRHEAGEPDPDAGQDSGQRALDSIRDNLLRDDLLGGGLSDDGDEILSGLGGSRKRREYPYMGSVFRPYDPSWMPVLPASEQETDLEVRRWLLGWGANDVPGA